MRKKLCSPLPPGSVIPLPIEKFDERKHTKCLDKEAEGKIVTRFHSSSGSSAEENSNTSIRRSKRIPKRQLDNKSREFLIRRLLSNSDDDLDLRIKEFSEKGRGIIAERNFIKGEFLCEYVGELVDFKTAKKLESRYAMDPVIGCFLFYFNFNGKRWCIDATKESGRFGRLINHSRVFANCSPKVTMLRGSPRLFFLANKDISVGSELLYDYGDRDRESLVWHPWLAC